MHYMYIIKIITNYYYYKTKEKEITYLIYL